MMTSSPCLCGSLCLCGDALWNDIHHRDTEIPQRHRGARVFRASFTLLVLLFLSVTCFAQNQTKRNDRPQSSNSAPVAAGKEAQFVRYTWEFAQPKFVINHIVIEHDALGHGKVSFQRRNEEDAIVEPIDLSETAFDRIQNLWRALRFLDSNESYQSSKNFAHLGTYKLGLDDGKRQRTTEFNWSQNADAWNLAQEYRRVADQAILVFDMTVARENQPLNTPGLLNQLETMYKRNGLSDPRQLVPLLKELRTDEHIPLIARNQAERLLKQIEK